MIRSPSTLVSKSKRAEPHKRWPDAIQAFEQVAALRRKYACEPVVELPNQVSLAEALLESRRDRRRAFELIRSAKVGLVAKKLTTYMPDLERVARAHGVRP